MNQEFEMSPEQLRLTEQLRQAVRAEEAPPFLEARIRAQIRAAASGEGAAAASASTSWRRPWSMALAVLAVIVGVGIAYQLGHLRFTAASQESYVVAMGNRVASIMRVGLGNHLHCAYFSKPSKTPPRMEQFVKDMGPSYAALIPVVRQHVPERYRLEAAHQCTYHHRKFVHVVLKNEAQLISLVITKKVAGESFETEGLLPALAQSGLSIYRTGVQRFQLASFETRDHLVYLISDLPSQQNMDQLLAMAPDVRGVLAKSEL